MATCQKKMKTKQKQKTKTQNKTMNQPNKQTLTLALKLWSASMDNWLAFLLLQLGKQGFKNRVHSTTQVLFFKRKI